MEWVTAARPRIDRCSTAWLIKRFIDPAATFLFVASKKDTPASGTPFDMPGAKHGHHGSDCTFETVVKEYWLGKDPALQKIASLVHDLDFHKLERSESHGVEAILTGLLLTEPDDHKVLEKSGILFDALYAREKARLAEAGR